MTAFRRSLRPEDIYHLIYVTAATLIILFNLDAVPHWPSYLAVHALIAAVILIGAPAALRWPAAPLRLVRDLYHLPAAIFYYRETAALHHALWGEFSFDHTIIALDARLFGGQPSLTFAGLSPSLVVDEVMCLAYVFYYALALIGGVALWRCRGDVFARAGHAVAFTMFVCYTTFVAFPVVGPSFHWPSLAYAGPPGTIGDLLAAVLTLDEPTGAFPSSHVAVTVAFLSAFWRHLRPLFWITLVPATLLILSTVFIRAHYASDAVAGVITGLLAYTIAERLRDPLARAWGLQRAAAA